MIGLVAAGAVAAVAWSTPTTEPGQVAHEQHTTFAYHADVPAGPVYPDGSIDTGDPIFLQVTDDVNLTADWHLTSHQAAAVSGSGQLTATVADGNGWQATVPLGPDSAWTGTTATLTGRLDLGRLQRLASRAGEVTGLSASSLSVTVTADLAIKGTLSGAALQLESAPSIDLAVSPLRALVEGIGEDGSVTVTTDGSTTVPDAAAAQLQFSGLAVDVPTARTGSLGLLVAATVVLIGSLMVARRDEIRDVHDRTMATHGDAILQVDALAPASHGTTAAVSAVDELVALANLRGLPVMRVPLIAGGYVYVVDDLATRYHCALPSPQHRARPVSEPAVPSVDEPDDRPAALL